MGRTINTQYNPDATSRLFSKHFIEKLEAKKPPTDKLFNVDDLEDYSQNEAKYTSLGDLKRIQEGGKYPENGFIDSFSTIYKEEKYGDQVVFTDEMLRYDKAGITETKKIAVHQQRQVTRRMNKQMAEIFNEAFNTSALSYGDNKPLCSTDHDRADGGAALSNADANGLVLNAGNLDVIIARMQETKDDRGELGDIMPSILLVPPALESEAMRIVKSSGRAGTADNDENPIKFREYSGGKLTVYSWNYIGSAAGGSDTAWFLLSDKEDHSLDWKWGVRPEVGDLDETRGKDTDSFYVKVRYAADVGWSDWRGVYGSKGDGQSYSS